MVYTVGDITISDFVISDISDMPLVYGRYNYGLFMVYGRYSSWQMDYQTIAISIMSIRSLAYTYLSWFMIDEIDIIMSDIRHDM